MEVTVVFACSTTVCMLQTHVSFYCDMLSCQLAHQNVDTNHLFHQNRILKLTDLFHYNVGIFMFQLSNNELPDVFLHMFRRNRAIHDYPTRQRDAYHLPRTRTLFAKKTIIFTGPRYWNDLPEEITDRPQRWT